MKALAIVERIIAALGLDDSDAPTTESGAVLWLADAFVQEFTDARARESVTDAAHDLADELHALTITIGDRS